MWQLLAVKLQVDKQLAALLMASQQRGMVVACIITICIRPRRIGLLYSAGAVCASCLLAFVIVPSYWIVFAALVVAAIGAGFFGAIQDTLIMTVSPDEYRGRVMGLLTLCIGAQPLGMFALGETAEHMGVRPALVCFALLGVAAHLLWQGIFPQARWVLQLALHPNNH